MTTLPQKTSWLGRNWKWLVPSILVIGLLIVIGLFTLMFYGISSMMKSSDAYKVAVERAQNDSNVIQAIGEPIEEGFFAAGNINTAGSSGTADMAIPLSGPKGDATVYLVAEKTAGQWQYSDLIVEIESSKDRIDLLKSEEYADE
jgi:Cytochrome oxidase complex assembly protein 1